MNHFEYVGLGAMYAPPPRHRYPGWISLAVVVGSALASWGALYGLWVLLM